MKYKEGQIVKIISVRFGKPTAKIDPQLTKRYKDYLVIIKSIPHDSNKVWFATVRFSWATGRKSMDGLAVEKADIIPATERETFLYYTHGSEVLRNEI